MKEGKAYIGDEKNIKDYLHLYLGCDAEIYRVDEQLTSYMDSRWFGKNVHDVVEVGPVTLMCVYDGIVELKPILRNLSDMTDEEVMRVAWLQHTYKAEDVRGKDEYGNIKVVNKSPFYYWINPVRNSNPETTVYLLKQGFDLFGLIESGLAIDKTTLNKQS